MNAPFEVVIINDYASVTGGSSAVALGSAVGLAARGIKVTLFTSVGPVAPHLESRDGLKVICLNQPEIVKDPNRLKAFARGLKNEQAITALRQELAPKDRRLTIIHVHTWTMALSP